MTIQLAKGVILFPVLITMCVVGLYGVRFLLTRLRHRQLILPWEELDDLLGPNCLEKSNEPEAGIEGVGDKKMRREGN